MTSSPTLRDSVAAGTGASTPGPARAGLCAIAYLVDLGIVLLTGVVVRLLSGSGVLGAIVSAEVLVVLALLRATTGRTPGAWATRTTGTAAGTDRAPGLRREGVRAVLLVALHATVVGPLITTLLARQGQTWIDRVAGTLTLDLRPGPAVPMLPTDAYGRPTASRAPAGEWPPIAAPAPPQQDATPHPHATAPATAQSSILPPAPEPRDVWLVADTGDRERVDAVLVVGRAPTAEQSGQRAVTVADPDRSLSRSHFRVGPDPDGAWVQDAFSSNGTTVRPPGGRPRALEPGVRTPVAAGSSVTAGDRTFTVLAPDPRRPAQPGRPRH